MSTCSVCGGHNPPEAPYCTACGNPFNSEPPEVEAGHIGYLLRQIPTWVPRGWVSAGTARYMQYEYSQRRDSLMNRGGEGEKGRRGEQTPAGRQQAAEFRSRNSQLTTHDSGTTPSPSLPISPSAFLEAHWLKLLAALAALLIFAGMRQLLGWEWVSSMAVTLIPLLPTGLGAGLYIAGMRKREPRTVGAFACTAVGIALAAFSICSIDKHWLGNAIPQPLALLAGLAGSTLLAGWTLRETRDLRFLHVLLAGIAATILAGLELIAPSPVLHPSPLALYVGVFEGLAMLFVVAAAACRDQETEAGHTLQVWAHLCMTVSFAWMIVPAAVGGGLPSESAALVAGAALMYAMGAQLLADVRMTYAGGVLAAAAAALLFRGEPSVHWYGYGFAALVYAAGALGLSVLNQMRAAAAPADGAHEAIGRAYQELALGAAGAAGAAILGRILQAAEYGYPLFADWREGVLLGALCAALYTLLTVRLGRAEILYGACATSAFALTLASNRLLPDLHPHTLAHDLLPFACLALALGIVLRRGEGEKGRRGRASRQATDGCRQHSGPEHPADLSTAHRLMASSPHQWFSPFLHSAGIVCALGLSFALSAAIARGPAVGVWTGLLPYALLCIVGAVATCDDEEPLFAQAWTIGALIAGIASIALAEVAMGIPLIWVPLALLPFWLMMYGAGHLLRESAEPLAVPLRWLAVLGSLVSLAASVELSLPHPSATSWPVCITLAAYGLAYSAGAWLRRTPEWAALASTTLTAAIGYRLATAGYTAPQWALGMSLVAAAWLLTAWGLEVKGAHRLATPISCLSGALAAFAAITALANAHMAGQGTWSVLALVVSGSVFLGLFLLTAVEALAHASFFCYLMAYSLVVYDHVKLSADVLDLYLIPLGLYLLALGHIAVRRGSAESARALWWAGLLTTVAPTYLAFHVHFVEGGTPVHALLLLLECTAAVGWGIAHRIRSFVYAGTLFSLAFVVTLAHGVAVEVWSGLFAVMLGVLMLGFVFYVSVHQDSIRRWLARAGAEWRQWR